MSNLNSQLGTTDVLWNLDDLYLGLADPAIDRDLSWCRNEAVAIGQEFTGKVARLTGQEMLALVIRLETLASLCGRLGTFAFLNFTTQSKNAEAGAFLQRLTEFGSDISRETVFFDLEWCQVEEETAAALLADPCLASYSHHLASIRRYAPHQLSAKEEKLLIEIAPAGTSSWTKLFDKVLSHMQFGEKKRTEEEVLADLYAPDREVRKNAGIELTQGLSSQLHVLTHVFNTLLADKMIGDRLRSYDSWISSMNLYNELSETTVDSLVEAVTSRYDIVQRYYRIKRKELGLDELYDYDRYAPLPHLPTTAVDWPTASDMVLKALDDFSPEVSDLAASFFDKKWIHAPIMDGKRGGAFAHPCVPEVHPYVMVNYTGNIRDVSTVAHELGHGVHQCLAAQRGYFNSSTPLVLAETASVFAELLLFKHQQKALERPEQRRAFVCQKLESIFATVFRQVSMNRFEHAVHTARRQQGELSHEAISEKWLATQRAMFADSVTMTDDYGIWWSYIPHFISSPGYVYSYAFGELLVLALYNLYLQDKAAFVPKYIELLAAGGSQSPYELVKPFGVDLDDAEFWRGGLQVIDSMLQEIEADGN